MNAFIERYGFAILIVAAAIWIPLWRRARATTLLNRWAANAHVQIVRREWRWVRLGPFGLAFFGHQAVYHLTVREPSGEERACWAKLGGFFRGLMSDEIEIIWEKDTRFAAPTGARW